MYNGIVDQAPSHPPRWVRLAFDLFKPKRRFIDGIRGGKVSDDVSQAGVMYGQQHGRIFIVHKSFDVAVHLNEHTPLIEHPEGADDGPSFGDVVSDRQSSFSCGGSRGGDELGEGDSRRDGLRACDEQEEPGCLQWCRALRRPCLAAHWRGFAQPDQVPFHNEYPAEPRQRLADGRKISAHCADV